MGRTRRKQVLLIQNKMRLFKRRLGQDEKLLRNIELYEQKQITKQIRIKSDNNKNKNKIKCQKQKNC